jgi:hypothetical protein
MAMRRPESLNRLGIHGGSTVPRVLRLGYWVNFRSVRVCLSASQR